MILRRFRNRANPLVMAIVLKRAAERLEAEGNLEGLAVIEQIRESGEMRDALRDYVASMMSAAEFANAPTADGEFIKWLLEWLIANLPAIIAMFTVV